MRGDGAYVAAGCELRVVSGPPSRNGDWPSAGRSSSETIAVSIRCRIVSVAVISRISTGRMTTSFPSSGRGGPILAATRVLEFARSYSHKPSAGAAAAGRSESPEHTLPASPADWTNDGAGVATRSWHAATRPATIAIAVTAKAAGLPEPDIENPA